jgi:hypothetical protein
MKKIMLAFIFMISFLQGCTGTTVDDILGYWKSKNLKFMGNEVFLVLTSDTSSDGFHSPEKTTYKIDGDTISFVNGECNIFATLENKDTLKIVAKHKSNNMEVFSGIFIRSSEAALNSAKLEREKKFKINTTPVDDPF